MDENARLRRLLAVAMRRRDYVGAWLITLRIERRLDDVAIAVVR